MTTTQTPPLEDDVKQLQDAIDYRAKTGLWPISVANPERIARLLAHIAELDARLESAVLAEREACIRACHRLYYKHIGPGVGEVRHGIAACADAIRQRAAIASEAKG